MTTETDEVYLGDGLYASFDGWQIRLRAPRDDGDHVVFLDSHVFQNLLDFAMVRQNGDSLGNADPVSKKS